MTLSPITLVKTARERQRLLTWPQTKASVEDVKLSKAGAGTRVQGHLEKPYTYYAKGEKKEGLMVEPGFRRQSRHYRNMTRFYLRRDAVYAYFNPNRPEEAYLQPGKDPLSWPWVVFLCLLFVGLPLAYLYWW